MNSLKSRIGVLAAVFADGVVEAVQQCSVAELLAGGGVSTSVVAALAGAVEDAPRRVGRPKGPASAPAPKTRIRRSAEQLAAVQSSIVTLLRGTPAGMRSEQIQAQLKLGKEEIVKPLIDALAAGQLVKKGERRATTYFIKPARAKKTAKKQPAKKATAKKAAAKRPAAKKTAKKTAAAPASAPALAPTGT